MERVVEGDPGAFAVYAMQESGSGRRELGDGESDAIAGRRSDWVS